MFRLPGPNLPPIEAARRLLPAPGRFLLDSASNADGCGRYAFVGAEPYDILSAPVDAGIDPFALLATRLRELEAPDVDGPVPWAVGYLGYDLGRHLERLPGRGRDDLRLPMLWFGLYGAVWRYDVRTGEGCVIGKDRRAVSKLRAALERPPRTYKQPTIGAVEADWDWPVYREAVERALAYIRAGDIYQVNLARRLRARIRDEGDPLVIYERIAKRAPAPFGALLQAEHMTLASNSPELFLSVKPAESYAETRPIKGTRARSCDSGRDRSLAAELASDAKELAEHLMIVDLERNDLGKVARIGSVGVREFARIVSLPTVHHLVSTVSCRLAEDVGVVDLLRATFPGGSITGAPKVRAMEIIDELEPVRRGLYTGAVGFIGLGGEVELAIVIRSAILAQGWMSLHVGGGIVADSSAAREYEETEEKAAAWRHALG